MRNLIVCLDGTWNTPDQQDRDRQVASNVVKMARAVKAGKVSDDLEQVVYYDTGVGTGGFWDKIVGGASGKGITKNITEAYRWLIENYADKDRLFLTGFSRGAYTARSLAGLLGLCGIPKNDAYKEGNIRRALEIYRIGNAAERSAKGDLFREENRCRPGNVYFIGVWDTVGALGVPVNPIRRWVGNISTFHDVTLGKHIKHAYHAVAINERRAPFAPTLWKPSNLEEGQTLTQVWFPGVHSNVGGGYVDTGLSDRAFLWMLGRAYKHGLRPDDTYVRLRTKPNWFGELRDSYSLMYKAMFWQKPKNRAIGTTHTASEYLHIAAGGRWHHVTTPEGAPDNFQTAENNGVPEFEAPKWEADFNR